LLELNHDVTETLLVGDIKCGIYDHSKRVAFCKELQCLMEKYEVDKVDVAWSRHTNTSESAKPSVNSGKAASPKPPKGNDVTNNCK